MGHFFFRDFSVSLLSVSPRMLRTHLRVPSVVAKRANSPSWVLWGGGGKRKNFGNRGPLDREHFPFVFKAVPKLRLLVAVLLPWRPRFDHELVQCAACGGRSGTGTVPSPWVLRSWPVSFIPPVFPVHPRPHASLSRRSNWLSQGIFQDQRLFGNWRVLDVEVLELPF